MNPAPVIAPSAVDAADTCDTIRGVDHFSNPSVPEVIRRFRSVHTHGAISGPYDEGKEHQRRDRCGENRCSTDIAGTPVATATKLTLSPALSRTCPAQLAVMLIPGTNMSSFTGASGVSVAFCGTSGVRVAAELLHAGRRAGVELRHRYAGAVGLDPHLLHDRAGLSLRLFPQRPQLFRGACPVEIHPHVDLLSDRFRFAFELFPQRAHMRGGRVRVQIDIDADGQRLCVQTDLDVPYGRNDDAGQLGIEPGGRQQ